MIPLSKLLEDLNAKVQAYKRRFPNLNPDSATLLIYDLAEADPTPNKAYLDWLVTQTLKGQIDPQRDKEIIKLTLEWFNKIKTTRDWPESKDINNYSFGILNNLYHKHAGEHYKTHLETKKEMLAKGSKLWYTDSTWRVYEVLTRGAALILGQGTKWCWASKDDSTYIADYLEFPPLLVILKNNKQYAAVSPDRNEFMDTKNKPIDTVSDGLLKVLIEFARIYPNKKQLMGLPSIIGERIPPLEPLFAKKAETAYEYARDAVNGPFPPFESIIARSAEYSYKYANYILHDRFPAGEPAIAKSAYRNEYRHDVLGISYGD